MTRITLLKYLVVGLLRVTITRIAELLLMLDELVVPLEYELASLALEVATRRLHKAIVVVLVRLVLVDLASFLLNRRCKTPSASRNTNPSILKPYDDHAWTQAELLRQHFQVVVLRVRLLVEEVLQSSQLKVGKARTIGTSPTAH